MSGLPEGWAPATLSLLCKQPEQRVPLADEMFTYIDIASVDRDLKTVSQPQRLLGADAPRRGLHEYQRASAGLATANSVPVVQPRSAQAGTAASASRLDRSVFRSGTGLAERPEQCRSPADFQLQGSS